MEFLCSALIAHTPSANLSIVVRSTLVNLATGRIRSKAHSTESYCQPIRQCYTTGSVRCTISRRQSSDQTTDTERLTRPTCSESFDLSFESSHSHHGPFVFLAQKCAQKHFICLHLIHSMQAHAYCACEGKRSKLTRIIIPSCC